jgi:superfamily II DNA or RNA helicase
MTVNLLKRLESSVHAFRLTLQKLKSNYAQTLTQISRFERGDKQTLIGDIPESPGETEFDDEELAEVENIGTVGKKIEIRLDDIDIPSWKRDLKADLFIIDTLLLEMDKITPDDDYKLQHLQEHIDAKIRNPINPGNKKVLIFTAFADTADYLYEQLAPHFRSVHGLHTAKVTGTTSPASTLTKSYDFQSVLTLFSPRSKEKALVLPEEPEEIDILITADCISEGQNLQDCDYLINYDIHWNPVRIIQRFGRIDRIGSQNSTIQLVNYWPDITLDE